MKKLILFFLFIPFILSAQTNGTFVDSRDNCTYKWVKIGEQTWMAENLNYNSTGSVYYNNDSLGSFGRLYNYDSYKGKDSTGICPDGWYIPSVNDWGVLLNTVSRQFAAEKLKSKKFKGGDDNYGFNALPQGRYSVNGKNTVFENHATHAYFWTSTQRDEYTVWAFFLYSEVSTISRIDGDRKNGFSIRCIKK